MRTETVSYINVSVPTSALPTLIDFVAHLGGDVDNTEWQMENLRPNAQTLQAMQEVLGNTGKQYASAQEYFAHLGI